MNDYSRLKKLVKCECKIKIKFKFTPEIEINKDKLINNFIDIHQISNFYVFECYKLLFTKKGIKFNIGNYILSIILIFNIIIAIFFKIKEYKRFMEQIIKIIDHDKTNNNKKYLNNDKIINGDNKNSNLLMKNSKNKRKSRISNNLIIKNPTKKIKKIKSNNITRKELKSFTCSKDHLKNINQNYSIITNNKDKSTINNKNNNIVKKRNIIYNDYELNFLTYKEALKIDKRNYFQYYISLIKRKQIIIFTFFTKDDYNPKIIKISLFLLNFSLYFTINGFFFNDSTMHQIYVDKGSFNFIYQIPQLLYSTIISSIINIIIKYFSLSENNVIKIKKKKNKIKEKEEEYKCISIKFIIYFVINFILLLLFWYYLSCFCAVYNNTQYYLLKDTLISYGLSLIYPFGLNLLPGIFRIPAINSKQTDKNCLYRISQIIQNI